MAVIRDIVLDDYGAILQLNHEYVRYTAPLDFDSLHILLQAASYSKVIQCGDQVFGFLIAVSSHSNFINDNLQWFQKNYENFIYVDRIVIAGTTPEKGLGTQLYHDLFKTAKSSKVDYITCEYNVKPLNEPSKQFHDKFGFREVGQKPTRDNLKIVSMQIAIIK